MSRLLLSPPHMGARELELVKEAFASNWIAPTGPHVDAFEREFCAVVGASHAAAVSSGTAALHLAVRMAGVGFGDEVFCSTLTFIASATPILFQGARPVFIDSEARSWNMDPALLAEELDRSAKVGRLPRAVILVHLYGQSADIEPIRAACDRHGVALIEDAAEALGATYLPPKTQPILKDGDGAKANTKVAPGTVGRFGIYSFNGNKIITTSGGGMLVSADGAAVEEARFLASQARDPAPHYQHERYGYNYRLSNILAAIGRGQLTVLAERVQRKRNIFERYQDALRDEPGIDFMPEAPWGTSTRWLTVMKVDALRFGASPEEIRAMLESMDIESRPVWKPMHLQPVFRNARYVGGSVSQRLFRMGLCLPSGTHMSDGDVERVAAAIRSLGASRRDKTVRRAAPTR